MDPKQVTRDETGAMRCRECGFVYSLTPDEVAEQAGVGLEAVRAAVAGTPSDGRNQRPAPEVWSVNAYTAHLVDAAKVIFERVRRIAEEDRPELPWHDQDQAVEQGHHDERPTQDSLRRLEPIVRDFEAYVQSLPAAAWVRVGIHSTAGEVRLADVAHDMPHELQHHAADIQRIGAGHSG